MANGWFQLGTIDHSFLLSPYARKRKKKNNNSTYAGPSDFTLHLSTWLTRRLERFMIQSCQQPVVHIFQEGTGVVPCMDPLAPGAQFHCRTSS